MKHIIQLPYTSPPLSLNDRGASKGAVFAKAAASREIFNTVLVLARAARLPQGLDHATVQLHYLPKDNRRRDTDNLTATAKPMYDALSTTGTGQTPGYGLVPDDDHLHMAKPEPIIHHHTKGEPARMWLEITTKETE